MLDRRFFIAGLGSTLIVPAMPSFAMTQGGAYKLVNSLVNDINGVIASGKSETTMYQEFERIFERYSDTSYISAYAMGVDGRRATSAQKRAFSNAFHTYIARKYGKRFQEFIGGRLEVKRFNASRPGTKFQRSLICAMNPPLRSRSKYPTELERTCSSTCSSKV